MRFFFFGFRNDLEIKINTKIDILGNLENSTNANKTVTKKNKILTKTAYFKEKLKINLNEFIDVLYTEDDINELYKNSEVVSKKTENSKKTKIIDLLYNKSDISNYQIIIKEDMSIKVFVLSHCVIRICCIDIYNKKYIHIFNYIKNRYTFQWGGLADQFDEFAARLMSDCRPVLSGTGALGL